MCGRLRCSTKTAGIVEKFPKKKNVIVPSSSSSSSTTSISNSDKRSIGIGDNISPGTLINVLVFDKAAVGERIVIDRLIWGLIPYFTVFQPHSSASPTKVKDTQGQVSSPVKKPMTKPDHFLMYNCRSESVHEKVSFKHLIPRGQRCVLFADGYYEWRPEAGEKQPYHIATVTSSPFFIAGLFDECTYEGKPLRTCTMLTMDAGPHIRMIHTRQPVFLREDQIDLWLNPAHQSSIATFLKSLVANPAIKLCQPVDFSRPTFDAIVFVDKLSTPIMHYPVTRKMNSSAYQGNDCVVPVLSQTKLGSFFSATSFSSSKKTKEMVSRVDLSLIDSDSDNDSDGNKNCDKQSTGDRDNPSLDDEMPVSTVDTIDNNGDAGKQKRRLAIAPNSAAASQVREVGTLHSLEHFFSLHTSPEPVARRDPPSLTKISQSEAGSRQNKASVAGRNSFTSASDLLGNNNTGLSAHPFFAESSQKKQRVTADQSIIDLTTDDS